jgi:AcrR family transcriptional regulator
VEGDMKKGNISQDRIKEAAFKLFINQGYHGTSMRQIAEAANLTPASIYNHYQNKEQIFRQVLLAHHPYHQILPILESADGEDAESILRGVANRVYKVIRKQKGLLHIMFIELVEFEGKHFGEIFRSVSPRIFAFLGKLKSKKGQLRKIPETNIMLTMIGLVMSQWILEAMFLKSIRLPFSDKHFEHALDIYMHGILAEKL